MIKVDVDFDIEKLFAKYRRIGLFMPLVAKDYNNRLAFNTRALAKNNIKARTTQRTGSSKFITGGRVLSVRTARFSRDVERIKAEVGGRVVPGARDPNFMHRLEFGGQIPKNEFGEINIPTKEKARRGNMAANITAGLSVPRLLMRAVSSRGVVGSRKRKNATAMGVAIRERKKFAVMKDKKGRDSIYRIKGSGRGKKRKVSSVDKIWTLSKDSHNTKGIHWLHDAMRQASADRAKVFRRVAEAHITRKALRGK